MGDPGLAAEIPLFKEAQAGCQRSLDQLMGRHEGLVQAVVRQQFLGDLSFAEALHAGRLGLWRAILGFDPQRGLAFSTYAWPAIMRHVWQAVKTQARQETRSPILAPPAEPCADPVILSEAALLQQTLHRLLQHLPERLHRIVVAYYGLQDDPPASYRQLGARLGLSHERVRQLHIEALVWLRHPAHSQTLRSLLHRHTLADYEAADALAQCWLQKRAGRHGH
jgi:RNA polymerase sigma factor (sigma-70 family)